MCTSMVDFPVKHLQSSEDLESFVGSTDRAFLLLDFCGWAQSFDKKQHEDQRSDMGTEKLLQHHRVDSFDKLEGNHGFEESTSLDWEDSNSSRRQEGLKLDSTANVGQEPTMAGLEQLVEALVVDRLDAPPETMEETLESVSNSESYHSWDEHFGFSNVDGNVNITDEEIYPMEDGREKKEEAVSGKSDHFCTPAVREHFKAIYHNFSAVARSRALTPLRQKFGIVTDKSVAVDAGFVQVEARQPWLLLAQVQDLYRSPDVFNGEGDVEGFILSASPSLVIETHHDLVRNAELRVQLEGEGYHQHASASSAFLNDTPSLILFIDRASASPQVRTLSQAALQATRGAAFHFASTPTDIKGKAQGSSTQGTKSVMRKKIPTDELLKASISVAVKQGVQFQLVEAGDLLKLLGVSSSEGGHLKSGNGDLVLQLKGEPPLPGTMNKLAERVRTVQELLVPGNNKGKAMPSLANVLKTLLKGPTHTPITSEQLDADDRLSRKLAKDAGATATRELRNSGVEHVMSIQGGRKDTGNQCPAQHSHMESCEETPKRQGAEDELEVSDHVSIEDQGKASLGSRKWQSIDELSFGDIDNLLLDLDYRVPDIHQSQYSQPTEKPLESVPLEYHIEPKSGDLELRDAHLEDSLHEGFKQEKEETEELQMGPRPIIEFLFRDGYDPLKEKLTMSSATPAVVVLHPDSEAHYLFPLEKPITESSLIQFVDRFLLGQLEKAVNSEPPPGPHREGPRPPFVNRDFHDVAPVPQVTVNTFPHLVLGMDRGRTEGGAKLSSQERVGEGNVSRLVGPAWEKDVVVLFTTSWCGFCKRMELVFREVHHSLKYYGDPSISQGTSEAPHIRQSKEEQNSGNTPPVDILIEHAENFVKRAASNTNDDGDHGLPDLLQIDCTLNDCTHLLRHLVPRDGTYPAVVLYPAQKKHEPVVYEGAVEVRGLFHFLRTHGVASSKLPCAFPGTYNVERVAVHSNGPGASSHEVPLVRQISIPVPHSMDEFSSPIQEHPSLTTIVLEEPDLQLSIMKTAESGEIVSGGDASHPGIGSLLVASMLLDNMSPVFKKTLILLVSVDTLTGIQGLIVNKPLAWDTVPHLQAGLQELLSSVSLGYGGPVVAQGMPFFLLSRVSGLQGFQEVVPGIYYGAARSARGLFELMESSKLTSQDLWVFLGHASWTWSQLQSELGDKFWDLQHIRDGLIQWPSHWTTENPKQASFVWTAPHKEHHLNVSEATLWFALDTRLKLPGQREI